MKSENINLNVLGNSIRFSDWLGWESNLPLTFTLKFDETDLYFANPDCTKPPLTAITIEFINPKSISFLTRNSFINIEPPILNWETKMQNYSSIPLECNCEYFSFTDKKIIRKIIDKALSITTIHGYSPKDKRFTSEKFNLAFWTNEDYGFAISFDALKLKTNDQDVEIERIAEINNKWKSYWERYCLLADSESALPKDASFDRRYYSGM